MCEHNFSRLSILAPMKHVRECSTCGYTITEIGTHDCHWQRGTICDLDGNEVFQIAGTQPWYCEASRTVLEHIPVSCDPNELGLRCYKGRAPNVLGNL